MDFNFNCTQLIKVIWAFIGTRVMSAPGWAFIGTRVMSAPGSGIELYTEGGEYVCLRIM